MSEHILTLSHVAAHAAGQQVVEDVTFEMPARGITALLGRNGVGKTSTLKAVLGLYQRSGEITLAGERIDGLPTHKVVRRGVGYVPEDREVFSKLSVAENLRLAERVDAVTDERRQMVAELFPDLVQRSEQMAGTLSGGQQQMVALGRALVNANRVLLVDEPTKGLAPLIVDQVTEALRVAAQSVPILLVEQNLEVVRRLADGAVVVVGGRVAHTGPAADLLADEVLTQRLLGVHTEAPAATVPPKSVPPRASNPSVPPLPGEVNR